MKPQFISEFDFNQTGEIFVDRTHDWITFFFVFDWAQKEKPRLAHLLLFKDGTVN